ncbi:malate dehydrogenase [Spirochaetia bacterium]|nr:malate dehydrogenase [Spirochaetia bacterium]GHU32879.1 malate dehydrogenase [Spirochaetia bacterium]
MIDSDFPPEWSAQKKAQARSDFLKKLSLESHRFYAGKMQTLPRVPVGDPDWWNVWYTPGISALSTAIRADNEASFALSSRGNLVAVVSDSTRVLGDGDCTPAGGLGVMEGKALLMKYLGAVDAVALCADTRHKDGSPDPDKLIEFVKMIQPSFGAINLEDISQPNCYRVLDELQDACDIPVWHDDAQGTACVTLAALLNALLLAEKNLEDARIVFIGAGAANSTVARFIIQAGGKPENIILFDANGALYAGRNDIPPEFYRQRELCKTTNPRNIQDPAEALRGADVLIALSAPGPNRIPADWIRNMRDRPIVFACANPIPELWPADAKEAGAFIVATGRGDFPNQVNNALCFPGILKGALAVRARKITDSMAIRCAKALAEYSRQRGIDPDHIIAAINEPDLFAYEAGAVAEVAVQEHNARVIRTFDEVYKHTKKDIEAVHNLVEDMQNRGHIETFPLKIVDSIKEEIINVYKNQ